MKISFLPSLINIKDNFLNLNQWFLRSSLILALQFGHLTCFSNHFLMHCSWNKCLQTGRITVSSAGSNSIMLMLPVLILILHSVFTFSDYCCWSLKKAKLFFWSFWISIVVKPPFLIVRQIIIIIFI